MELKFNQTIESETAVRGAIRRSFAQYASDSSLRTATPRLVRAGCAGGLPFDSLTTDIVAGCLSAAQVCYGSCFAAQGAFEAGIDFGKRVPNILDEEVLCADLAALPPAQGYLRNGWNSDPSWDWKTALLLAEIISASNHHPVFITKAFKLPDQETLELLARIGAEIRISVSALDTDLQIEQRLELCERYRKWGGVAAPVIMTACFCSEELNQRQNALVEYFLSRDFPLSENSLRFPPRAAILELVNTDRCGVVGDTGDYWSGRLYLELRVPTLTTVPAGYSGMQSPYLSQNEDGFLQSLWHDPVSTHEEVMSDSMHTKPRQCGVPTTWISPADIGKATVRS
jgi:hypothetical protein